MSDTVTLPVNPETFWGLVGLGAVLLVGMIARIIIILLSTWKPGAQDRVFTRIKARLGLAGMPEWIFMLGMLLWGVIFTVLFLGLLWTIISAAFHAPARTQADQTALRFVLISLTALTATLGAVVAFPVMLIRIALTRKQTETAEEALFNDKINAAAEGLAARRQVTKAVAPGGSYKLHQDFWEDDLVTRASAIDRLEGLAKERPDTAARVARMLSVYVRELSREYPAQEPPEGTTTESLILWAWMHEPARPDMEKAAQSLGRLQRIEGHTIEQGDIDLRYANLQGFDLAFLTFENALFEGAKMQGANLSDAEMHGASLMGAEMNGANFMDAKMRRSFLMGAMMQGANLWGAKMQGANLRDAKMQGATLKNVALQGAKLWGTKMQGAYLSGARMQGAYLMRVEMDELTDLSAATLRGAAMRFVDEVTISQLRHCWGDIFADETVQVPNGARPDHWENDKLDENEFHTRWHAWQETLPEFDPSWRQG